LLFAIYGWYLNANQKRETIFQCTPLTTKVATQTTLVLKLFGYEVQSVQHETEMSVKIIVSNRYIARVIEGCNAISIIILFVAFIIAFSGPIKVTVLYVLFGSFIIYGMNILRIALLTMLLIAYPAQQEVLHNLVFPMIIYGTTFLLWVVWVRKFSDQKK
jgi:exosortase family protein XrtF